MFKNTKELAALLDGREYTQELTKEEEGRAKELGLIIVFGASDDLVEFRGYIHDASYCYGGGNIQINRKGLIEYCADECCHYKNAGKNSQYINVVWEGSDPCWSYETDIRHEKFTIMEDGEKYCEGIVFHKSEMSAQKNESTVIEINDNLRIARTPDDLQWQIQELHVTGKKSKEAGKEVWKGKGYYTKLEYAGSKCLELIVGHAGESSVTDMFNAIEQAKKDIIKAVGQHEGTK